MIYSASGNLSDYELYAYNNYSNDTTFYFEPIENASSLDAGHYVGKVTFTFDKWQMPKKIKVGYNPTAIYDENGELIGKRLDTDVEYEVVDMIYNPKRKTTYFAPNIGGATFLLKIKHPEVENAYVDFTNCIVVE